MDVAVVHLDFGHGTGLTGSGGGAPHNGTCTA
jgi:hypothetical protein